MTAQSFSVDGFMSAAAPPLLRGSSPRAARYAGEVVRIFTDYANRRPRSLQVHLGPSEIGTRCDREVVGKLTSQPTTNHVADPLPSTFGTWLHAGAAEMLDEYNARHGVLRFVTEQRVTPHPDHPGTADAYDAVERAVGDHKFLGASSMAKVRSPEGPSREYVVQLLLYAHGYRLLGLPVDRVYLIAWPRTGSTIDGLYVWEREHTPADEELLAQVFDELDRRKAMADLVRRGHLRIDQVPVNPDDDRCYFCPFYRPESAKDGGPGCPGARVHPA